MKLTEEEAKKLIERAKVIGILSNYGNYNRLSKKFNYLVHGHVLEFMTVKKETFENAFDLAVALTITDFIGNVREKDVSDMFSVIDTFTRNSPLAMERYKREVMKLVQ